MKPLTKSLLAILVFSVLIISGCQQAPDETGEQAEQNLEEVVFLPGEYVEQQTYVPNADLSPRSFADEESLKSFLAAANSYEGGYGGAVRTMDVMMVEESAVAMDFAAPAVSSKGVAEDFSQTNNQVLGVDEGDIIKTDGEYIYTVTGKDVFIVKAYPGEDAEVVSTINVKEGYPNGLFLHEDKLVVFGSVSEYDDVQINWARTGMTFFYVYDLSDVTKPKRVKEYSFEGGYFQSRMIEEHVYIVTRTNPYVDVYPLPIILEDDLERSVPIDSISYFPMPYDYAQFVTIHAIDMGKYEHSSKTLVVESSQNMYMSEDNIYISYTKWINEWELQRQITVEQVMPMLSEEDKDLIAKIKAADNDLLTQAEKENKIHSIVNLYIQYLPYEEQEEVYEDIQKALKRKLAEYDYFEYTVITKVSVDDLKIDVQASGEVPGSMVNQFSMDEYKDVLRVGTTVNQRWSQFDEESRPSSNHVFTLDEDLEIIDSVDDIAKGERIFSTRFMGDKLYMVTFRQVDPFFVIDLSNPNKIKVLGELKIPGFSRYLHPYDEKTIIGIGRDATETGRTQGLKISLFDVSDVHNPKEVAQYVSDQRYASSSAEYEHKAFLFSKEKNLLVIPAYSYDYKSGDNYNGAFVFDIARSSIELRGLIDHGSDERRWSPSVERSLYIEELLYTKSANLLRINEIDDLSSVKNIDLKSSRTLGIPIY